MQQELQIQVVTGAPVIKQNAVPYNFITQSEAQSVIKKLNHKGGEDSLPFGVQMSLACVYIEHFGKRFNSNYEIVNFTKDNLNTNTFVSTICGNCKSSTFKMDRGFYYYNNQWNEKTNNNKSSGTQWLCTTGASEQNKILNMYDFSGNVAEFTLENTGNSNSPCWVRGGSYSDDNAINSYKPCKVSESFINRSARASLFIN